MEGDEGAAAVVTAAFVVAAAVVTAAVVVVVVSSAVVVVVVVVSVSSPATVATHTGGTRTSASEVALIIFFPAFSSFTVTFPSASVTYSVASPLMVITARVPQNP